jgi:hypothetical protein
MVVVRLVVGRIDNLVVGVGVGMIGIVVGTRRDKRRELGLRIAGRTGEGGRVVARAAAGIRLKKRSEDGRGLRDEIVARRRGVARRRVDGHEGVLRLGDGDVRDVGRTIMEDEVVREGDG